MKMTKEKTLLLVVAAVVAGVGAMDGKYEPVRVPATRAPDDVPPLPAEPPPAVRHPRPEGRSLFDAYNDLLFPPLLELPEPPRLEVPVPIPPVRPFPHLDAARGLRHYFFDPVVPPPEEEETETAGTDGGEAAPEDGSGAGGEAKAPAEKPKVDLATFDWVQPNDGLGQTYHGRIEILDADAKAGRTRFDLLVHPDMEFTFAQVDPKTGRLQPPLPFRARTEKLGFADTLENNFGSRMARAVFAAGRVDIDTTALRDLAAWCMEQAGMPRYRKDRRKAMEKAAECYCQVLRRNPDDVATVKDLGKVYRALQDAEREVALYDWWLEKQVISKDPEILALGGEGLESLGLLDRARVRYEESLVTNPDPRIRLRLADILAGTGSLEDARRAAELFRKAASEGEPVRGITGEGRALLAAGDAAGAKAALARLPQGDRDAAWYLAMGAVLYCEAPFPVPGNPALLAEARGHFQAAFDRSAPATETRAVARTNLAVVGARLAALMAEDDPARRTGLEEALALADEALKDDPFNYYWPLVARGYALRALGQPDKAVEALQEAVAAWPGEAYGRTLLGEFLLRDGRFEEARTHFLAATRIATAFPDALGGVGRAGGGEPGEARDYLRRAMELEPRVGIWPLLSARALMGDEGIPLKQRLEEARKDLTYLVEKVDRSLPLPIAALGWVRYLQGDPDEALDRWNTAQRLLNGIKPSSPREAGHLSDLGAWLNDARVKVSKWKQTRIWRDEFDRPDGPTVGNGWTEEEKNVKITLKGGAAVFGPGIVAADEVPKLWREWDAARLLKGTVEITVLKEEPEQVDVFFWIPQGKNKATQLGLRKDESGKAFLLVKPDHKTKDAEIPREIAGFIWPEDGKVSFTFVKMDETKGTVALLVNGQPVPGYETLEVQSLMKSRGGKIRVQVECTAQSGTEIRASVEAVEAWLDIQ